MFTLLTGLLLATQPPVETIISQNPRVCDLDFNSFEETCDAVGVYRFIENDSITFSYTQNLATDGTLDYQTFLFDVDDQDLSPRRREKVYSVYNFAIQYDGTITNYEGVTGYCQIGPNSATRCQVETLDGNSFSTLTYN